MYNGAKMSEKAKKRVLHNPIAQTSHALHVTCRKLRSCVELTCVRPGSSRAFGVN